MCYAQFGFIWKIKNMIIRTFGGGRRLSECERTVALGLFGDKRIFITPIPTTRDKIYITGSDVRLTELLTMLRSGDVVAGYNLPIEFLTIAEKKGALVYDGATDERFLKENAELTARGTVGYILTHCDRDISDMSVGIVGYGRIGSDLVRWLLLYGAKIRVFTNRDQVMEELGRMEIGASYPYESDKLSELDLLINTAPARQIDVSHLSEKCRIIDLASGNIFDPDDRLIKLSSVPENYYPITSGRLYGEGILRKVRGEQQ